MQIKYYTSSTLVNLRILTKKEDIFVCYIHVKSEEYSGQVRGLHRKKFFASQSMWHDFKILTPGYFP